MPGKCEAKEDWIRLEAKAVIYEIKPKLLHNVVSSKPKEQLTQGNLIKKTLLLC